MDARLLAVTRSDVGVDERVARLFDVQYLPLCRLAGLLLNDPAAAEDIVQEAFLQTFSRWRRLRDPERAERYLRRVVVNLCRSRCRHRDAERRANTIVGSREAGDIHGRGRRAWDGESRDTAMVVLDAIQRLPPRQRMSIVLRYYLDLSEGDVAELMGCTVGTVKSQVAKAKAALAGGLTDVAGAAARTPPERLPQTTPRTQAGSP